ncbi:MAG: amidohydrolase family protein, partial [Planctomycetota bacterium]
MSNDTLQNEPVAPAARYLLRGGHVVDPATTRDSIGDVLIEDGRIAAVGDLLAPVAGDDLQIVDVQGLIVCPGLIDMHAHLREPGDEEEETIASGAKAAAAGGVTSVAAFPTTEPSVD